MGSQEFKVNASGALFPLDNQSNFDVILDELKNNITIEINPIFHLDRNSIDTVYLAERMEYGSSNGSANSMSLRSKSAKLLSYMPSSPGIEPCVYSPHNSVDLTTTLGSARSTGEDLDLSRDAYQSSKRRLSNVSSHLADSRVADLIFSLNLVKENLHQEQERRRLLDLELKSIQKECEVNNSRKSATESHFKQMAEIIDSIKASKETITADKSYQLNSQIEDLENLFTCTLEEFSPELLPELGMHRLGEPKIRERRSSTTLACLLPSASCSNSSIVKRKSNRLSRNSIRNSLRQANLTDGGSELSFNIPDGTVPASKHKSAESSSLDSELEDHAEKHHGECNYEIDKHNENNQANEEGLFCYIEDCSEPAATSLRPMSTAQANRHSAIIGDNLFSLRIQYDGYNNDKLSDEKESVTPLFKYCGSSDDKTISDIEPLTPSSVGSIIGSRDMLDEYANYAQPSAVPVPKSNNTTSASPSEDSPTVSCRVGRTLNAPLGMNGNYVKRKFTSNKVMLARSSVTAYKC